MLMSLLSCLLPSACDGPGLSSDGKKITLPETCWLAQLDIHFNSIGATQTPKPNEYLLFDQKYPGTWPPALKLPDPSYLTGRNSLEVVEHDFSFGDIDAVYFNGLCEGTPETVMKYFKDQTSGAGLSLIEESEVAEDKSLKPIIIPKQLELKAFSDSAKTKQISVTVYNDVIAGKYVFFSGSYWQKVQRTIKINER